MHKPINGHSVGDLVKLYEPLDEYEARAIYKILEFRANTVLVQWVNCDFAIKPTSILSIDDITLA